MIHSINLFIFMILKLTLIKISDPVACAMIYLQKFVLLKIFLKVFEYGLVKVWVKFCFM